MGQNFPLKFCVFFFPLRGKLLTWSFRIKNKKKKGGGVTVFGFFFQQTGRNEHCLSMGVNGKRQKFGSKYRF